MMNFPWNQPVRAEHFVAILACVLGLCLLSTTGRADTVRLEKQSFLGDVKQISPESITLVRGSSETPIEANKIVAISFSDEPRELTQAREAFLSGRFEDAIAALNALNVSSLTGYVAADAAFYRAAADAELALRGRLTAKEASEKLVQFIKTYPSSYHYYQASRLVGDLFVAAGRPDSAASYYGRLEKAPWTEYQTDAKIATISALLADGKSTEARTLLDQLIASETLDPVRKSKIDLLEAENLLNENKPDEAIRRIEELIKTISPEEINISAEAYNMLGRAHLRANRPQEALLAFLHVDLLYSGNAISHAEALSNLAELWTAEHQLERARLAIETLKQRYPFSRWNK